MLLSSRSHALYCRSSRCWCYRRGLQAEYHGILSQASASRPDSHVTIRAFTQSNDTADGFIETIRDGVYIRGSIPAGGIGVAVGQYAEVERIYTIDDVEAFGRIVRDGNPLHRAWKVPQHNNPQQQVDNAGKDDVPLLPEILHGHPLLKFKDDNSREQTQHSLVLVHGMLVASLFTSIFGTLIPGAVYSQQSLHFVKPVYVDHTADLSMTTTQTTSRNAVTGRVTIQRIRRNGRNKGLIVTCDTVATKSDKETVLHGQATVWLPRGSELVVVEEPCDDDTSTT